MPSSISVISEMKKITQSNDTVQTALPVNRMDRKYTAKNNGARITRKKVSLLAKFMVQYGTATAESQ
jgi:histone H3/H4